MKNNGLGEKTVTTIGYQLRGLARKCNLNDPAQVKMLIANSKTANATKNKSAYAYDCYCRVNGLTWKKPFYDVPEKAPLIPTPQSVQAIIDNATKRYAVIFTIESEIGCSPEELHNVTQKDIDVEKGVMSITGVKGHGSANYKLKPTTAEMLRIYLEKHTSERPFPSGHAQSQIWIQTRQKAYEKTRKPEILKVQLRNLRNYSGERFYKSLPVRDPIAVMRHLRHKKLETTMHYIRAIVLDYEEDDQWTSLVTRSPEEECKAIEKGYTIVRAINETTAIYRKRK